MLLSSTLLTMDTSREYFTEMILDDEMMSFHDNQIDAKLQRDTSLQDSTISFTKVTNISTSSDEEFCYDPTNMYDSSLMEVNSNKFSSNSSSDIQCVPECDENLGLGSRSQYYSDFLTDHHHLSLQCDSDSNNSSNDLDCDEIPFPRVVEGCEDLSSNVKHQRKWKNINSDLLKSSDEQNFSDNSSKNKWNNGSLPCASSTMIHDITMDTSFGQNDNKKQYGNNSMPHLLATVPEMSNQQNQSGREVLSKSDGHNTKQEDEELKSIFTWSIHDDGCNKGSIEELYLQNVQGHVMTKPQIPLKKIGGSRKSKTSLKSGISISGIEPFDFGQDSICDEESMFNDDINNKCIKAKYLPRTSTRIHLTTGSADDFHRVPEYDAKRLCNHQNKCSSLQKYENSHVMDKKAVIKKLKKFNKSLRNFAGESSNIKTLASL